MPMYDVKVLVYFGGDRLLELERGIYAIGALYGKDPDTLKSTDAFKRPSSILSWPRRARRRACPQ